MNTSIAAVILAGGASSRMEQPKALLRVGGTTFLQHIASTIAAATIADVVIVLGAGHDVIQSTLGWFTGRVVVNDEWESGQLSSIKTGIASITGIAGNAGNAGLGESNRSGILIWPVDHPLVSADVIGEMVRVFQDETPAIVVPVCRGRRGHPVIISPVLFDEVRAAPIDAGLRFVVRAHEAEIRDVVTEDEGVLINIDTPDQYARYIALR